MALAKCPKCETEISRPITEVMESPIHGTKSIARIYIVSCQKCGTILGTHIPIGVDLALQPVKRLNKAA